jgi:CHAD domain-containing protein
MPPVVKPEIVVRGPAAPEMATAHTGKWILDVAPSDRTSDIAVRTLKARFAAVQHYLPLAAEKAKEDAEYVHELRVWTRRASAALDLYEDFLPRRRRVWMKGQLKRLRRAANDARDYDVLAQQLAREHPGPEVERWLEKVRTQRCKAQRPIVAIHERLKHDDRFARRIMKLLRRVRLRVKKDAVSEDIHFEDWARSSLRPIVRRFFKATPADGIDVAALHKLRIRAKDLRYAMELLAGAFSQDFREKLYPVIESLQDKLGEINDRETAQVRLRQRIDAADDKADVDYLRKLSAEERSQLKQARREFLGWCSPQLREDLRAHFYALLAKVVPCCHCTNCLPQLPTGTVSP